MEFTASNIAVCTMAIVRVPTKGAWFTCAMQIAAFSFQSVITSAAATRGKITSAVASRALQRVGERIEDLLLA
jgi:hypothetical protein